MSLILLASALLSPAPATARPETIFNCRLGAKSATVTLNGGRFTYRYGTAKKAELTITETAATGNLHGYTGRYASILSQLRFNVGDVSYILYTMGASRTADTVSISGLTVLRGTKVLSDKQCKPFVEYTGGFDAIAELPQDEDNWSAMSLG